MEEKEEHLIKKVSKGLGITYKELAKEIGYTESNLRRSVSDDKISKQLKKAIELYLQIVEFKRNEEETEKVKDILRAFISQKDSN